MPATAPPAASAATFPKSTVWPATNCSVTLPPAPPSAPINCRVLAKDVKEPKVLVGVVLGAELAKLGPRKRLQAALEEADHDGKNPELDRRAQEERSKQCDESVAGNAHKDHLARTKLVP